MAQEMFKEVPELSKRKSEQLEKFPKRKVCGLRYIINISSVVKHPVGRDGTGDVQKSTSTI